MDMESHEQFTRLWTQVQAPVAAFLGAVVPDLREAEDLLQEVAVILLRKFGEYDPARPFLPWAMGVARLEALSARRDRARHPLVRRPDLLEAVQEAAEEAAPEMQQRTRALRDCIRRLKARPLRLVQLRYEEDLKPQEIASRLGVQPGAVRTGLSRVRDVLQACIGRHAGGGGGA